MVRGQKKENRAGHKPSSVSPGKIFLGTMIIPLGTPIARVLKRPTRELGRATLDAPLFGLAPGGVYRAPMSPPGPVSSYLTVSPLPRGETEASPSGRFVFCGTFLPSPGLRITEHPALWSSDFPPPRSAVWQDRGGDHSTCSTLPMSHYTPRSALLEDRDRPLRWPVDRPSHFVHEVHA
jgi:hypothetical protein